MQPTRVVLIASIALAFSTLFVTASSHDVAGAVFGGSVALNSFRSAQRVTVERVHGKPNETLRTDPRVLKLDPQHNESADLHVLAFYRSDTPAAVATDDVRTLKQLLSDPRSYLWLSERNEVRACLPDYAVMFTFYGSPETVRVLLCFRCDQLAVLVGKGDDPLRVNAEDVFDDIRPQLLTIVKRLFPNDPDIQALPQHLDGT